MVGLQWKFGHLYTEHKHIMNHILNYLKLKLLSLHMDQIGASLTCL